MADFFESPGQDRVQKDEIEILDKQQHEYKFIGRQRKVPGHTMWSLNIKTMEIKKAPVEHAKAVDFTGSPTHSDRIVVEPNCVYRQALNRKNFIKRLLREGIIVRRPRPVRQ